MVSWPNLAFFQIEFEGIMPSFSRPRKFHDLVVCNFLPWFRKTETTLGWSAFVNESKNKHNYEMAETRLNNKMLKELLTGYLGSFMVVESCSKAIDMSCV